MEPIFFDIKSVKVINGKKYYRLRYDPDIFKDAECKGVSTITFYPDKALFSPEEERFYARLCSLCPIKLECLEWGLAHENHGVWGGTTPVGRTRIRKEIKWGISELTTAGHLPVL